MAQTMPRPRVIPPKRRLNPWQREALTGYAFAAPWILGFLALTLGPMLFSLYASFTRYNIVTPPRWLGLDNYQFLFFQDERFRTSLYNTLYYVVIKTPIVVVLALLLALLMNMRLPGQRFFRTIFYLPTVITGVAAIFLWVWVLNPEGLLNRGLGLVGVRGPNWFYDPAWSKPGLIVMSLWYLGTPMLILLAALNGVPKALYEAAEIDGAGIWARFWNVTVPLISPALFFVTVTNIIGAFQVFSSAYVVSRTAGTAAGDPAQSLLFYEVYLWIRAFEQLEMGYASAMAWILFVIIMAVTGLQLWLSKRWVYYEG
jgi:multiple sugar transport system permease protein